MTYEIISSSFGLDLKPNPNKNFDFVHKDEETISLYLSDGNVEEITEFVCGPDEPWYLPFKVGPFIEKKPMNLSFIKNCVLVKYQRHPEQTGTIMQSQKWEQGLKDAKKQRKKWK